MDRFILAKLKENGLHPAPEADRATLLRRVSFDLTGLPPTLEEVDGFVNDKSSDAYEKQVERLMASPHFGERMAMYWLDLVRYADSVGYHSDNPMNVSPYRDWVINAFNQNEPFDRFTTEQLAGDLLPDSNKPEPTLGQKVASAYNRLLQTTEEGGAQGKEYEAKYAADRVRNVSTVWLGATMGCCQCHDHKFDPFSTKDFYSMAAFFADVQEASTGRREPGIPVPDAGQTEEIRKLDASIAEARRKLAEGSPDLAAAQADWEKQRFEHGVQAEWKALEMDLAVVQGESKLRIDPDGILHDTGNAAAKETYTLTVSADTRRHHRLPSGGAARRRPALSRPRHGTERELRPHRIRHRARARGRQAKAAQDRPGKCRPFAGELWHRHGNREEIHCWLGHPARSWQTARGDL